MNNSDLQRIERIKTYCEDVAQTIERYGNSIEIFADDRDYVNSVSMSILQIGELSIGLSEGFKDITRDHVQWDAMKGMRNYFAHGYGSMDRSVIWETATKDIPNLLQFCKDSIKLHCQS
jgi:uncharacterized protein with HEPN domain